MADYYADRVVEGTTTTGVGTLTLDNVAPAGYRTLGGASVPSGSSVVFLTTLKNASGEVVGWEISRGTFTSPATLTRALLSSSTGALINWGAGTKTVSIILDASAITEALAIKAKNVTDATDISLADIATSYSNFGTAFTANIPTEGLIVFSSALRLQADSAATALLAIGIRIATTNYWPRYSTNGTISYATMLYTPAVSGQYRESFGNIDTGVGGVMLSLDIAKNAIPTGEQTIQAVVARLNANTATIKGTVVTSRAIIQILGAT